MDPSEIPESNPAPEDRRYSQDPFESPRELGPPEPADLGQAENVQPVSPLSPVHPSHVAELGSPRWWTPLAISALAFMALLVTSTILLGMLVLLSGNPPTSVKEFVKAATDVSQTRLGLVLLVGVPQLAMVSVPIMAAIASPVPTRKRLGLVRGHWPMWTWVAAAAATPLVGMVSGLVIGSFVEESESLKEMTQLFRQHGENGFLIPLALLIGATPAICEELLFRGYVQTRLTRSFGPALGIIVASFLFAAFHFDFVHVIAVFPMGLFLGWVSWRSGSLFPAMLGHFVNNVVSVVAVVLSPEADPDVFALPAVAFTLSILAAGVVGMGFVLVAAVIYGRPQTEPKMLGRGATHMV